MPGNLLAFAIGSVCAQHVGLFKLVLPRSLPGAFKKAVAESVESAGGIAVRVGTGTGELSPGEAISFRTPEDGGEDKSILLLATEGDTKELKSLEAFRNVLTGGLPGGLVESPPAVLGADSITSELAGLAATASSVSPDKGQLARALEDMMAYLAAAYRHAGNDEKRWTDAFWQHVDALANRLPFALSKLPGGTPGYERDAVTAAAGLPRPAGAGFYASKNGHSKYADIVLKSWNSPEELDRSLVEIDRVDRDGRGTHPLLSLDWNSFASSRADLGHPLLAVAYHGSEAGDGTEWLHGWASTSEAAFFEKRNTDAPDYALVAIAEDGQTRALEKLDWQGLDHLLPPGPRELRADGNIGLGTYRLDLEVNVKATAGTPPPFAVDIRPKSACKCNVVSWQAVDGILRVTLELSRRPGKKGGKWREKPFTLSASPLSIAPGSDFLTPLELKVCAAHPARATAIALENRRGRAPLAIFATDEPYEIQPETREILPAGDREEPASLKLRDGSASSHLAVVGRGILPTWVGGTPLKRGEEQDGDALVQVYGLSPLPDDAVVELDGYRLNLQFPEIEKGQVNPMFAAIAAEPVVPVDQQLRDELLSDPRGVLEQWYQKECISSPPSGEFRSCLGTCVLEVTGRGISSPAWNPGIGAFSNTSGAVNLQFPGEVANSKSAETFWEAFDALELQAFAGPQQVSAWPGALDLREMDSDKLEAYLAAFCGLLDVIGEPRSQCWAAYPFSALLYNQQRGEPQGVLMSPLHPLRLAWAWSVQSASDQIAQNNLFGRVAPSFLRFVDGELIPAAGPAIRGSERWISTGLAPGPREFFAGWSLLAGTSLRDSRRGKAIGILGLELPYGTPSGLDQGGVSAALRDYLRVYPASPQLRIGLSAPAGGERFAETDQAIIAASGELLAHRGDSLPGGVRIFDSSERQGNLPSAVHVLQRILPEALHTKALASHAPFEWTKAPARGTVPSVDLQFMEDTVVRVHAEEHNNEAEAKGTATAAVPFSRYRSWRRDEFANYVSSFALGLLDDDGSGMLPSFDKALGKLEELNSSGEGIKLTAELSLGDDLLGDQARWTITGNRHLDPSVLSSQLSEAPGEIALWEWRPAFLAREKQRSVAVSVASTHPYTVLARPSNALTEEIANVLSNCGVSSAAENVKGIVTNLGMRGVGLSSLLTMGHTQSLGAIGFHLAFKSLEKWEDQAGHEEIRCAVPMDAVYPLLDLLGEGANQTDDQRRADLLLLVARFLEDGKCELHLHPVEVKMRGKDGSFPKRGARTIEKALGQLESTSRVLEKVCENHGAVGSTLALINGALATFLEAALCLRPAGLSRKVSLETRLLRAVASGMVRVQSSPGTLLWFQVNASGVGGGLYEKRPATAGGGGLFFANPKALDTAAGSDEVGSAVAGIIDQGMASPDPGAAEKRAAGDTGGMKTQPGGNVRPASGSGNETTGENQGQRGQVPLGNAPKSAGDEDMANPGAEPDSKNIGENAGAPLGVEILVGHEPVGASWEPVYFKPSETALNQLNIGVVGDLGTGKTQFLKSLVYQLSRSTPSNRGHAPKVFIFDYKRDYSEGEFPGALGAKVLDPARQPLPINFFAIDVDARNPGALRMEQVRRANFFSDLLRRISSIGQVQRNDLYSSVMQAYQACAEGYAPTVDDVFEIYASLGKNDSVVSVLTLLRDLMVFETNPENTTTFKDLFDRNTVLNLSGLSGAGQDIVDIVATIFLDNLYTDYMKTLPKEPFIDGPDGISRRKIDSFVLIDEAHHAMGRDFDVLMKLMLEGREFGMGVVLSSQFLSHFESGKRDWGEALSTWAVHNVRNASAKQFERIGFRRDVPRMVQDVTGLETHWTYYRCMNGYNEGVLVKGQPFYSLPRD